VCLGDERRGLFVTMKDWAQTQFDSLKDFGRFNPTDAHVDELYDSKKLEAVAAAEAKARADAKAAQAQADARQAAREAAFLGRETAKQAQIDADLAELISEQDVELDAEAKKSGKPRKVAKGAAVAKGIASPPPAPAVAKGAAAPPAPAVAKGTSAPSAPAPAAPPADLLSCGECRAGKPADDFSKSQLKLAEKRKCRRCIEESVLR
jgi:hypothetical protein